MNEDKAGKFDGLLTDVIDADTEETYVVPGYVETKLSKDKRQECRGIVKTINGFGVSQRQKLYLIYLLALELENRESMQKISKVIAECKDTIEDSKLIVPETQAASKKLIIS